MPYRGRKIYRGNKKLLRDIENPPLMLKMSVTAVWFGFCCPECASHGYRNSRRYRPKRELRQYPKKTTLRTHRKGR